MNNGLNAESEKIATLLKNTRPLPVEKPFNRKKSKQRMGSLLRFSAT